MVYDNHSLYIQEGIMNIVIGTPYESAIQRIIKKGYAGNQTEVIRQAILAYERMLDEEECMLVHKAAEVEADEIESGAASSFSLAQIKKGLRR